MKYIDKFALLLAAFTLPACVSILPEPMPAPSVYRLNILDQPVMPRADAEVIRVDRPASSVYFDSTDIVVSPDGRKLATASGAKWAEVTPTSVQQSILTAMAGSDRLIGVLPSSGTRTETRLHVTIRNFEAQFDQGELSAPLAIVQFDVTLANASDRKLLGTFTTKQTLRAKEARVSSIVEAIEGANQAAMMDIITWLETETAS